MKRDYVKFDEAVKMLRNGWEIFTDRGFGGTPYTPLFFHLHKGEKQREVHHATIKKLISEKIINSRENESGTGKYALRSIVLVRWQPEDAEKLAKILFGVGAKAAQKKRPDLKMHDWDGLQDHVKEGHLAVAKYIIRNQAPKF